MPLFCYSLTFDSHVYVNLAKSDITTLTGLSKADICVMEGFHIEQNDDNCLKISCKDDENNTRQILFYIQEGNVETSCTCKINNKTASIDQSLRHDLSGSNKSLFITALRKFMFFRLCKGFEVSINSSSFPNVSNFITKKQEDKHHYCLS